LSEANCVNVSEAGFFFFFLVGLGFELRASGLQSRTHISSPFSLVILEMGVLNYQSSWSQRPK
jgi:hypothetical protein